MELEILNNSFFKKEKIPVYRKDNCIYIKKPFFFTIYIKCCIAFILVLIAFFSLPFICGMGSWDDFIKFILILIIPTLLYILGTSFYKLSEFNLDTKKLTIHYSCLFIKFSESVYDFNEINMIGSSSLININYSNYETLQIIIATDKDPEDLIEITRTDSYPSYVFTRKKIETICKILVSITGCSNYIEAPENCAIEQIIDRKTNKIQYTFVDAPIGKSKLFS